MLLPTVSLCLTPAQFQLIYPGIAYIDAHHILWRSTGRLPHAHPELRYGHRSMGSYDSAFGQMISQLTGKLNSVRSRRARLRLNVFEVSLLALGARVTSQLLRHGHLASVRKDQRFAQSELLCKLENIRKQAKRAFICRSDESSFAAQSQQWTEMLTFIRTHFLHCCCRRRAESRIGRHFRRVVKQCCLRATEGLKQRQAAPFPDDHLRRLVQLALRYVRRNRTSFGIRTLLERPQFASAYLAEFVLQRSTAAREVTNASE